MNVRRLIGSVLVTAFAASSMAVIATAAPATAATAVQTRVVAQVSKPTAVYGDKISVTGQVQGLTSKGEWVQVPYGTGGVVLQFRPNGSSTWRNVQSDDSGDSFYFYPVTVKGSGAFRVAYQGGSNESFQFNPSSTAKALKVKRGLTVRTRSGRSLALVGRVAPASRVKVIVLKKVGRKWKVYKAVRTTSRGRFVASLPAPSRRGKKVYWLLQIQATKTFVKTRSGIFYTTRY